MQLSVLVHLRYSAACTADVLYALKSLEVFVAMLVLYRMQCIIMAYHSVTFLSAMTVATEL